MLNGAFPELSPFGRHRTTQDSGSQTEVIMLKAKSAQITSDLLDVPFAGRHQAIADLVVSFPTASSGTVLRMYEDRFDRDSVYESCVISMSRWRHWGY